MEKFLEYLQSFIDWVLHSFDFLLSLAYALTDFLFTAGVWGRLEALLFHLLGVIVLCLIGGYVLNIFLFHDFTISTYLQRVAWLLGRGRDGVKFLFKHWLLSGMALVGISVYAKVSAGGWNSIGALLSTLVTEGLFILLVVYGYNRLVYKDFTMSEYLGNVRKLLVWLKSCVQVVTNFAIKLMHWCWFPVQSLAVAMRLSTKKSGTSGATWLKNNHKLLKHTKTGAFLGHRGFIKKAYVSRELLRQHAVFIGGTKRGKTEVIEKMIAEFALQPFEHRMNFFIADPKNKINKRLTPLFLACEYRVQKIDVTDIAHSLRINILRGIEKDAGALKALLQRVKAVSEISAAKQDQWAAWGLKTTVLFTELTVQFPKKFVGFHQVEHLIQHIVANQPFLDDLFDTYGTDHMRARWDALKAEFETAPEMAMGVIGNAEALLTTICGDPKLIKLLCTTTTLDLNALRCTNTEKPTVIFLVLNPRDIARFGFFASMLYDQVLDVLSRELPPDNGRDVLLVLEELTQIPKMEKLAEAISFIREYKAMMCMCVQSMATFKHKYGSLVVDGIMDNIGIEAYCGIKRDARELSERIGNVEKKEQNTHGKSWTNSTPLITRYALEKMPISQLLVFLDGTPALLRRFAHTNWRYWRTFKKWLTKPLAESVNPNGEQEDLEPQYLMPDAPLLVPEDSKKAPPKRKQKYTRKKPHGDNKTVTKPTKQRTNRTRKPETPNKQPTKPAETERDLVSLLDDVQPITK